MTEMFEKTKQNNTKKFPIKAVAVFKICTCFKLNSPDLSAYGKDTRACSMIRNVLDHV